MDYKYEIADTDESSENDLDRKNYNELDCKLIIENGKPVIILCSDEYNKILELKRRKYKRPVLTTLDIIFSTFIVTPCVVACWRGIWEIMDIYSPLFPVWESFLVGITTHIIFALAQELFEEWMQKTSKWGWSYKIVSKFMMRLYTYVFVIITNLHWRSGWNIFDSYVGFTLNANAMVEREGSFFGLMVALASLLILVCMKSVFNVLAPPMTLCLDKKNYMFRFPTRFKVKMEEKTCLYILDCLFSVLVIGTLVVFVWRGAWVLIDILLFPDDPIWSAWGSLVVGYTAVAIAFSIQPVMRWMCDRLTGAPRLVIADLFILFSLIGTVNVWRGIWNLLDIYFIPENQELSCWVTHWASLILLILLGCSNSLLVRGVYIDAEEPAGKCVVFPCYYLRLIFQQERLKKLNMKLQIQDNEKSKQNIEKITPYENNHVINVTTISNILEENHK